MLRSRGAGVMRSSYRRFRRRQVIGQPGRNRTGTDPIPPGGGVARSRLIRRSTLALTAALSLAAVVASQLVVGAAAPQDGRAGSGGTAVAHRAGGRVVSAKNAPDGRIYRV